MRLKIFFAWCLAMVSCFGFLALTGLVSVSFYMLVVNAFEDGYSTFMGAPLSINHHVDVDWPMFGFSTAQYLGIGIGCAVLTLLTYWGAVCLDTNYKEAYLFMKESAKDAWRIFVLNEVP